VNSKGSFKQQQTAKAAAAVSFHCHSPARPLSTHTIYFYSATFHAAHIGRQQQQSNGPSLCVYRYRIVYCLGIAEC
jgi:hypothetical protein